MLIDFHTHCFSEKIAQKAMESLSFTSGGMIPEYDGTLSGLKENMKENGVTKSVVLNIATSEKQHSVVNKFACEICDDEIIGFGSVYPLSESAVETVEEISAMGLKGIKLHPEYQNFYVDDERLIPLYKKISEKNLIVVFHSGSDFGYMYPYHCTPKRLLNALKYLECPVVAAHWGAFHMYEEVEKYLCGKDIYFDTSFGYASIPKPAAMRILEKHTADKILFGTDTPWSNAKKEKLLLESLELCENELSKIYFKNASILLGLGL